MFSSHIEVRFFSLTCAGPHLPSPSPSVELRRWRGAAANARSSTAARLIDFEHVVTLAWFAMVIR